MLKKLLEETGLFAVDVETSPKLGSNFNPAFSEYDVVVMNYASSNPWPKRV